MAKTKQKKGHEIKGFISFDGYELSFDDYINAVKKGEEPGALPVPVLEGIKKMLQDNEDTTDLVRVTSVLGCPRKVFFEKTIGPAEYVYPAKVYPMFRGTIAHSVMEAFPVKDSIDEKRFIKEYNGIKFTGKPDRILISEKKIQDYKTTVEIPAFGRAKKSHEEQLNFYRWLISDEHTIDKLEVIYISMKDAKSINVRVWEDYEIGAFLDKKVKLLKNVKNGIIEPYKESPLCPYCDFRSECKDRALNDFMDQIAEKVKNGGKAEKGEVAKRLHDLTIL